MSNIPPLSKQLLEMRQNNVGRLFQRAARKYSEDALNLLHELGHLRLTLFHTILISHLDIEGTRISELAKRAGVTKQAISQIASELDKLGYVKCGKDPSDRRAVLIYFTQKGKTALRDAYKIKLELEKRYSEMIGESTMGDLRDTLSKLVN